MHEYCVLRLRMSEGAAFKRLRAARAVRRFPILLEMRRDGRLSPAAICLLHPHRENPDGASLIIRAREMRARELEATLSERAPRLVRFAFTSDEESFRLLERVRALMRHEYPDGRLDGVLRDALQALLGRTDHGFRWDQGRRRATSRG